MQQPPFEELQHFPILIHSVYLVSYLRAHAADAAHTEGEIAAA